MQTYVISLEKTPDRKKAFEEYNKGIIYNFFEAVDGEQLLAENIDLSPFIQDRVPYTVGGIGVALSHLMLWKMCEDENEVFTIIEDDAIIRNDFDEKKEMLLSTDDNWDCIVWGWNFDAPVGFNFIGDSYSVMHFCDYKLAENDIADFKKNVNLCSLVNVNCHWGIPAYSITPKGAKKLKELCFPLRNDIFKFPGVDIPQCNTGIDMAMSMAYSQLNSYISIPPMVVTKNDKYNSTIQNKKYIFIPNDFNLDNYLLFNPDVAQSGMDPYVHYIVYGQSEGRRYSY